MPPALPPNFDDYDVRIARRCPADARHGHRLGDPPTPRLCHRPRPLGVATPNIVHDADRLHLQGPPRHDTPPLPPVAQWLASNARSPQRRCMSTSSDHNLPLFQVTDSTGADSDHPDRVCGGGAPFLDIMAV